MEDDLEGGETSGETGGEVVVVSDTAAGSSAFVPGLSNETVNGLMKLMQGRMNTELDRRIDQQNTELDQQFHQQLAALKQLFGNSSQNRGKAPFFPASRLLSCLNRKLSQ